VLELEEINKKLESKRVKAENKEKYRQVLTIFQENFIKYANGFVVFKREYLIDVYGKIKQKIEEGVAKTKITYDEILTW